MKYEEWSKQTHNQLKGLIVAQAEGGLTGAILGTEISISAVELIEEFDQGRTPEQAAKNILHEAFNNPALLVFEGSVAEYAKKQMTATILNYLKLILLQSMLLRGVDNPESMFRILKHVIPVDLLIQIVIDFCFPAERLGDCPQGIMWYEWVANVNTRKNTIAAFKKAIEIEILKLSVTGEGSYYGCPTLWRFDRAGATESYMPNNQEWDLLHQPQPFKPWIYAYRKITIDDWSSNKLFVCFSEGGVEREIAYLLGMQNSLRKNHPFLKIISGLQENERFGAVQRTLASMLETGRVMQREILGMEGNRLGALKMSQANCEAVETECLPLISFD
jgi:hypothetical protein